MDQNKFSEIIHCLYPRVNVDALIICENNNEFKYVFTDRGKALHEVRSLSKLIVAICVGIAIDSGRYFIDGNRLSLDTKIWSTLKEKVQLVNIANVNYLENITIRNLLTQTTGYSNGELLFSSSLKKENTENLLDIVFNEPIVNEPGKKFVYSNASAFVLSAFLQELTGENLYEFAKSALFAPLEILQHSWVNYGKYCAGATGLNLLIEDVHKLGKLILHKGKWNNQRVISEKFISEMLTEQIEIVDEKWKSHTLSPTGYGFFVWINRSGYYVSGARGQYIFIIPDKKTVISILSDQEDTVDLLNCIKNIL